MLSKWRIYGLFYYIQDYFKSTCTSIACVLVWQNTKEKGDKITLQTIREYADNNGITYEAVRQQIAKHNEELKPHIKKENGTSYLTDKAIELLDSYRTRVQVVSARRYDEITELLEQQADLQAQLLKAKDLIIQLQAEQTKGIEAQAKLTLLLEQKEQSDQQHKEELEKAAAEKEQAKIELAQAQNNLAIKQDELAQAQEELEQEKTRFKKSIFGLYKKLN